LHKKYSVKRKNIFFCINDASHIIAIGAMLDLRKN